MQAVNAASDQNHRLPMSIFCDASHKWVNVPIYGKWTLLLLSKYIDGSVFYYYHFILNMPVFIATSIGSDQTPRFVAANPSLPCFQVSL